MKWLRFPRILGVIVSLYLVAMSVLFGYLSIGSYRFVHNAAETTGTVVSLEVRRSAGSQRDPNPQGHNIPLAPKVSYIVDGKTYFYTAAHGRVHQPSKVGDTVTVLYDPADPEQAQLRGEGRIMIPLITSAFVTTALVLGVVLYLTRNGRPRQSPPWAAPFVEPPETDEVETRASETVQRFERRRTRFG